MNIVIDNVDFWDGFDAMKYWSHPKTYDAQRKRDEIKAYIMSEEYIGARKVDGVWAMVIRDNNGKFHLRSRSQNVEGTYADKAEWIPHIIKELDNIPNGTVLLGEIYKKGDEGSRKTTAILNCLLDKSLERQKKTPLSFYIFDCLAYNGKSLIDTPIETRIIHYLDYELLDVLKGEYISVAEYFQGEELWNVLGEILSTGHEGVVIQKKSAPYTPGKRTARLTIKVKKEIENTIDAFIDGDYKEPTKEYYGKTPLEIYPYWFNVKTGEKTDKNKFKEQGMGETWIPITRLFYLNYAGSISFSVMKDSKPVHIGYISGLPDEVRKGIVAEPDKWIGKVYEITCMELEHVMDHYSMRHAKIVQERSDKIAEECDWSQISIN